MAYSRVFWKRNAELADSARVLAQIERGEKRIERRARILSALAAKCHAYKQAPVSARSWATHGDRASKFHEAENRFLVEFLHSFGFERENVYEELRFKILEVSNNKK